MTPLSGKVAGETADLLTADPAGLHCLQNLPMEDGPRIVMSSDAGLQHT